MVSISPLYTHSYLVATPQGYTKHYYAGDQRIGSKIGTGGFGSGFAGNNSTLSGNATDLFYYMTQEYIKNFDESESWQQETEDVEGNCYITSLSGAYESEMNTNVFAVPRIVSFAVELKASILGNLAGYATNQGPEREVYFFHSDHLGGASWITNASGAPVQHLRYAPFGDPLVNQRSSNYNERFTFTGKERDEELRSIREHLRNKENNSEQTGYYYYSARYHWPSIGFLSVDPKADEQPWQSPYIYCSNNPITRVDPTGMLDGDFYDQEAKYLGTDGIDDGKIYIVPNSSEAKEISKTNKKGGTTSVNAVTSAVELPSLSVRKEMSLVIEMDAKDPFREYGGGVFGDENGNPFISWAKPGKTWTGLEDAEIDLTDRQNPEDASKIVTAISTFHSHPSGEINGRGLKQKPSSWGKNGEPGDIQNAATRSSFTGNHYVFGAGNGSVYIYNGSGVKASFPINSFKTLGR